MSKEISDRVPEDFGDPLYANVKRPEALRRFYQQLNFRLAWASDDSLSVAADSAISFIGRLRYFGLNPVAYHALALEQNIQAYARNIVRTDILLSDALLSVANDITFGCTAKPNEQQDSLDAAFLTCLVSNSAVHDAFAKREPAFDGYRQLKNQLAIILDSLTKVKENGALVNAGEEIDPVYDKVRNIAINMERWRRERVAFGNYYVLVNIPAFMLYVIKDDSVVMSSRVIVGKPDKPTPILSSTIECITTYPYWNVPRKIAVEEYLPVIQQDITFLEKNYFDVLDRRGKILKADSVPWAQYNKNYFPVLLRQREGTENALGVIKFVFDNPYGVFLHDTNAKRLFKSQVRAFSHGCIRMEKAEAFAHYLIMGDLVHKSKYLSHFLKEKEKHFITLKKPIPIYVRYFTADIWNDGLHICKDIYDKDETTGKALGEVVDVEDF